MTNVTLEEIVEEIMEWADTTFPNQDPQAKANHLYKEAAELKDDPSDRFEIADVLILAFHLAHGQDIDVVEALQDKLEILRTRTWGEPDAEGVIEHVRD